MKRFKIYESVIDCVATQGCSNSCLIIIDSKDQMNLLMVNTFQRPQAATGMLRTPTKHFILLKHPVKKKPTQSVFSVNEPNLFSKN